MKLRLGVFLLAVLAVLQSGSLLADTGSAMLDRAVAQSEMAVLEACPAPAVQPRLDTAQVSQADCCKGHKGVCGCRAGKIVCCDNTASLTCTCHSDWAEAN